MTERRTSARIAAKTNSSSPLSAQKAAGSSGGAGSKRKAAPNESPSAKRGNKQQKTLEETLPDEKVDDEELKQPVDGANNNQGRQWTAPQDEPQETAVGGEEPPAPGKDDEAAESASQKNSTDKAPAVSKETEDPSSKVRRNYASDPKVDPNRADSAIEVSTDRNEAMPSTILEKGVIYFFVRGRVNVDDPKSVKDIARTYIVLRPLPHGAKLGEGPIEDLQNNRLLALPKKVLPKGRCDTFMTFVEKAGTTIAELKENFSAGSIYETKTTGVSHSPPVTPVGEGVYVLTTTGHASGKTTHLAYILTLPNYASGGAPSEVQTALGLAGRGSFILSAKNPSQPSPAGMAPPAPPAFPQDVVDEFRGLRWMAAQPRHLDYANAQFLLIGEAQGDLGKAVQATGQDTEANDKRTPEEEMEKLGDEDLSRLGALNGDDTVFDDLGLRAKEYPSVMTTW